MPSCGRCKHVWTLEAVTVCPRCNLSICERKAGLAWVWGSMVAAAVVIALLGAVSAWRSGWEGSTVIPQPVDPAQETELNP